ncbi:Acg family FMN-binding oxidoreductase [Amycolatopsis sp. PS_44_ISF1]|uniref:Acg family FMN-binding oxidoreductase n=1 Tax=Amycolatopsis sp. PS_44_ISF1 TaxID=2974917 RepID=UPI0028DF1221|nr:hypothetical protein [Amycolatopsis sp. PS_44_ISF1]MDT8912402.1 hypothetical protein [Amycolatopsis sp. PS_44_ISF1]
MSRALPLVWEQALASAVRAPSLYNTQPWRFVVEPDLVQVWLDRDRVLAVADPRAGEARLACGAAVFNAVTALRAGGVEVETRIRPDRARPDLLATLRLDGKHRATAEDGQLARAVFQRRTNRFPFLDQEVPAAVLARLRSAARSAGGYLKYLRAPGRYAQAVSLIRRAEAQQASEPAFDAEAAYWTDRRPGCLDGVPRTAAGPPACALPVAPVRASHRNPRLSPRVYEQEPLLAVVLTREVGPGAEVEAGMTLQRVLLTVTVAGLSASLLTQPFEIPAIRREFDRLFPDGRCPQTLLRLGYGYRTPPTSRRPVESVVAEGHLIVS